MPTDSPASCSETAMASDEFCWGPDVAASGVLPSMSNKSLQPSTANPRTQLPARIIQRPLTNRTRLNHNGSRVCVVARGETSMQPGETKPLGLRPNSGEPTPPWGDRGALGQRPRPQVDWESKNRGNLRHIVSAWPSVFGRCLTYLIAHVCAAWDWPLGFLDVPVIQLRISGETKCCTVDHDRLLVNA